MVCIAQSHKVRVVGVVVLDEDSFVLKTNDGDSVLIIIAEGTYPQPKRRPRSHLLPRRRSLAPVEAVDRPCSLE